VPLPILPDIVLQYTSFKQITDDISDARVYGGIQLPHEQAQTPSWATLSVSQFTRRNLIGCTMATEAAARE